MDGRLEKNTEQVYSSRYGTFFQPEKANNFSNFLHKYLLHLILLLHIIPL